ncbi:undecaprenyl-diphosphate phosphatase [Virgibacillus proomii]|nr:undecaprenyl-diphosphate phosphatase [Virgibacillus proomii]
MEVITDTWTTIQYLILGLVQGITEPLPISSSEHIVIIRELF